MIHPEARQLREELLRRVHDLANVLGPDVDQVLRDRCGEVAVAAVAVLASEEDDQAAADTAVNVMACLWPHGDPEHVGQPQWWATPLGRLLARSAGRSDAESVSHSVAAAMLGVHRGSIAQWVARGTLDRHPDGGVLRASVLHRLTSTTRPRR